MKHPATDRKPVLHKRATWYWRPSTSACSPLATIPHESLQIQFVPLSLSGSRVVSALGIINALQKLTVEDINTCITSEGFAEKPSLISNSCLSFHGPPLCTIQLILTHEGFLIHWQTHWHAEVRIRLWKKERHKIQIKLLLMKKK